MSDGWNESAQAWIAGLENSDDFARPYVLDRPMLDRVRMGDTRGPLMLDVARDDFAG